MLVGLMMALYSDKNDDFQIPIDAYLCGFMADLHKKSWTVSNSGVETMEVDDKADSEVNTPIVERKEAEKRKRSSSRYVTYMFILGFQVRCI